VKNADEGDDMNLWATVEVATTAMLEISRASRDGEIDEEELIDIATAFARAVVRALGLKVRAKVPVPPGAPPIGDVPMADPSRDYAIGTIPGLDKRR
jgi:hypothetical protein